MWRLPWLALLVAGCAALPGGERVAGPVGLAEGTWREQTHYIPMPEADGRVTLLLGRVCRPAGEMPGRVVVIAHGAPAVASRRATTTLTGCSSEAAQWFLSRGYVTVFSLRRGYGGTGGAVAEDIEGCGTGDYRRAARESARDVDATVAYALKLPYARPDGAVVVGHSAGGWAALGVDAAPHPHVSALVSMAGGRGGHQGNRPFSNCKPENLVAAAGLLGRTATTPMLWVYALNDTFFVPSLAASMHKAFTDAGGRAELDALPANGDDGHQLFFSRGGSLIWGPLVEQYLAQQAAGA